MRLHFAHLLVAAFLVVPASLARADDATDPGTQLQQSNDMDTKAVSEPMSQEATHDMAGSTFDGNSINDPGVVDLRDRSSDAPRLLRDSSDSSDGQPIDNNQ